MRGASVGVVQDNLSQTDPIARGLLEQQNEMLERLDAIERVKGDDVLLTIMGSYEGRLFVDRLLQDSGVDESTFHESHAVSAYASGRRSVGLDLLRDIRRVCHRDHILLLQERHDRDRKRAELLAGA